MNDEREQILRQLRQAADVGLDSEAFYQALRRALSLGPVPQDVLREIRDRHLAAAERQGQAPHLAPEQEQKLRQGLRQLHEPSARAQDPNHPVGAVALAIRAALPEFQPWQVDIAQIDLAEAGRRTREDRAQAFSCLLPPDFTGESEGSYISAERAPLIKDRDGAVLTLGELFKKKATRDALMQQMRAGGCLSDVLGFLWKRLEPLELTGVEDLLRRLAEKVVPATPVRLSPYEEPRFRAALRMQLGDNPIPAAIGAVLRPWQGLPQRLHVASATIYLEPWATARSGQTVELVHGLPLPSFQE